MTHHIPTSCLPTLLIFMHIEHTFWICTFLVAFFSATIDGRNLIFGHKLYIGTPYRGKRFLTCQISTSCLTKSGGIIQFILFVLVFFSCYTPTHREGAILQSPCPSVHTFVTDISASTLRNDFIFHIWLWHGDLYRVSPFQVYRTSTSCLQCDLEFFMFAVMKTFVTVISASTGRNDFIFDIWLWHGDLYRVSPFQVYRTSTSCLPCDLQMNEWRYS